MKLLLITHPEFFDTEITCITNLFQCGLIRLHLRKPQATESELEDFIQSIPSEFHNRIVLHDHHALALRYSLYGIHLNSRNPVPPQHFNGSVSRSCHSLEELIHYKDCCDYLFLSPIFDSISKAGYHSAYTPKELQQAAQKGIINEQVYALGGISLDKLRLLKEWKFGGAVLMGDVWQKPNPVDHFLALQQEANKLKR